MAQAKSLARVCPPCIVPTQNIETAPLGRHPDCSPPAEMGKSQVVLGGALAGAAGAPIPRSAGIDRRPAVGRRFPSTTDTIDMPVLSMTG
jgi:hypothetical protein